jgi:hypothetical protein
MPRDASDLQLLQNPMPRELESLPPPPFRDLLGSQNLAAFFLRSRLLLLLFN